MAEDQEQDQSQKTEAATERRLEKAREKGQIPLSREVNHLLILFAASISLVALGPFLAKRIANNIKHFLFFSQYDIMQSLAVFRMTIINVAGNMMLGLIIFILAALGAGFSQTKFVISSESMKPRFSKISPWQGIKKVFGQKNLIEFLKGMLKIILIGSAAYCVIKPEFEKVQALPYYTLPSLLRELHNLIRLLFVTVISILLIIAIADYMYQRFDYLRRMRMSRHDIKEEAKETSGDPLIKQKLKALRRERVQNRMMTAVPNAAVILTNPTHYAVALAYEHGVSQAPKVVAKGADLLAFRIRELAQEYDVPIVENPSLTRELYKHVDVGQEIPEQYYQVVAQVIRYILGLDRANPRAR